MEFCSHGERGGTRTLDPMIKSHVLSDFPQRFQRWLRRGYLTYANSPKRAGLYPSFDELVAQHGGPKLRPAHLNCSAVAIIWVCA